MKLSLTIFIIAIFFSIQASAQDISFQQQCKHAEHESMLLQEKWSQKTNSFSADYDLKYHRFELDIDPAVDSVKGSVTSYFIVTKPSLQHLKFNLTGTLVVDSVRFQNNNVSFSHVDDTLDIDLGLVLAQNALDSVTVFYGGTPPSSGFGSFEQTTHAQAVPVIWTLSEPYGAHEWWPCKQDLTDKIDSVDFYITIPKDFRATSNGVLVLENVVGQSKIVHWKHRYPIANYLIAFAVTNYRRFSNFVPLGNDTLEVVNYVYSEDSLDAVSKTQYIIPQVQLYDSLFGPYPFMNEQYGHTQFSWGGGMEHQTMSFMGNFNFDLMAHELAHQWFGNKITCGSWQDIWLNEGFATYLTALTFEFIAGDFYWNYWKDSQIDYVTEKISGSVFVVDTSSVSRIFDSRFSYSKGALVLHMARWVLGDSLFFQSIRNYINDPNLVYSFAKTDDLKQHFENTSGLDFTEFFDDWVYGHGYPSYSINYVQHSDDSLHITIDQTASFSSITDFFEMPVPLQVFGGGKDTMLILDHQFSGQEFHIALDFQVDSMKFDPERWIVSKNNEIVAQDKKIENLDFSVYPNPAKSQLNVQFNSQIQSGTVSLLDLTGKLISKRKFGNTNFVKLDISKLISGMYLLKVLNSDDVSVVKFIKK